MRSEKDTKRIGAGTTLSSFLVLMIAAGHVFMPSFGYSSEILKGIDIDFVNHFYFLGTYAICLFLFFTGLTSLLSIRLDVNAPDQRKIKIYFLTLLVFLWIIRLVFEFIYPVNIKIFFTENPHTLLTPVLSVIIAGYTADLYRTIVFRGAR